MLLDFSAISIALHRPLSLWLWGARSELKFLLKVIAVDYSESLIVWAAVPSFPIWLSPACLLKTLLKYFRTC